MIRLILPLLFLLLPGCLARAALDVATLPVKAAGQVAETAWDAATTTSAEAAEDRAQAERRARRRAEREARRNARPPD